MAEVLRNLGSERVWVVHGSDGIDELTTTGPSTVVELKDGELNSFEVTPEEAGLARVGLEDLKGGDGEANAGVMAEMLDGAKGPIRDIVLLNTAAALIVAGQVENLKDGVAEGAKAIDSGAARATLDKLIDITNRPA
jgi:anthranilate phosphoribosyltransferase